MDLYATNNPGWIQLQCYEWHFVAFSDKYTTINVCFWINYTFYCICSLSKMPTGCYKSSFPFVGLGLFFIYNSRSLNLSGSLQELCKSNILTCLYFSDDAPIVVPKRGRSTKVSVSSVLVWEDWRISTRGTGLWLAETDRASAISSQSWSSNHWLDNLHNREAYSNSLFLYFCLYH